MCETEMVDSPLVVVWVLAPAVKEPPEASHTNPPNVVLAPVASSAVVSWMD